MENLSEKGHCHGHDGNTTAPILEAEAGVLSLRLAWTAEENPALHQRQSSGLGLLEKMDMNSLLKIFWIRILQSLDHFTGEI